MLVFAHRGESALFPENSRTAIRHCNDSKMDGLEIDLFETGDLASGDESMGDFVVVHDRWLTRLFNIDLHVTRLSPEDLASIKGNDNEPLPTLAWLIEYCAPFNFTLNIEIKYLKSIRRFEEQLAKLCTQFNFDRTRLIISSFNHHYLKDVAIQMPDLKLGLLLAVNPLNVQNLISDFPLYSVHLDMDCLNEQLINTIKSLGLKVFVFTIDHEDELNWLNTVGVDGVFSNNPRKSYDYIATL